MEKLIRLSCSCKVRVWMREGSLGAGSVAELIDHNNGSYTATLKAFWVGQPEVRVAIITTRQVIAAQFKRRLVEFCLYGCTLTKWL